MFVASKIIPSLVMSFATSLTTPAASSTLSTGISPNACATSLGDGLPDRLAGSDPKHNGEVSEDRVEWKELQKHCETFHVDPEETDEQQQERIHKYETLGNVQLSEGRMLEVSVDLVLQARARLCEGKVNGPRDNCERDAEATTAGQSLRGCKILPRTTHRNRGGT